MKTDKIPFAKDLWIDYDFKNSKYTLNELVIGPTGAGKSYKAVLSKLTHTYNSSLVVPLSKKESIVLFSEEFRNRGYEVEIIDLVNPENSTVAYDPLDYVRNDRDIVNLSSRIISACSRSRDVAATEDPYWNESAAKIVSAIVGLARMNSIDAGIRPSFCDVKLLHRTLVPRERNGQFSSSLDTIFDEAAIRHPYNIASENWKVIKGLSMRTASCIMSIVNNKLSDFFDDTILEAMKKEKRISFRDLGKKKTLLFIYVPPYNNSLKTYLNLLYGDMMEDLFKAAQEEDNGSLPVHTEIIFDDFFCSKIEHFEDYISIMRAANMSCTLLLQDLSQLEGLYGKYAADTIRNNCPLYTYFGGGNDLQTCRDVAERLNVPLKKVMELPVGNIVVFRPGAEPYVGERYPVLEDPEYRKILSRKKKEDKQPENNDKEELA
ncbi:MAG: type IV secretory system conjugative DNA transfer family protein [Lachnospiraceae bacterium]|nr:type IV secretory system conjugative DNA transfer family protein [Lachnospiraceae bacterium]